MAEILRMNAARVCLAGCLLLCPAVVGCAGLPQCATVQSQYVLVERFQAERAGLTRPAEITDSPAYKVLHAGFKTVALRLPDNCYQAELHKGENEDAAQLESSCGIPLQVLERTLTEEGYQVLSWSTLMGIEHQQNVPVHVAAQQLGADIVIIVNDMKVGFADAGDAREASYRYFLSNAEGERLHPAELYNADRAWLKEFVRQRVGDLPAAQMQRSLQARLNATVVLVKGLDAVTVSAPVAAAPGSPAVPPKSAPMSPMAPAAPVAAPGAARSGEAIWFYNRSVGKGAGEERGVRFLFGGIPMSSFNTAFPERPPANLDDPNRHYWWPAAPDVADLPPEPVHDLAASEETSHSTVNVTPEEAAQLFREVATDFIRRFKKGG